MNEPQQSPAAVLRVAETGQTYPLSAGLVTIGRKGDNTIVLGDDLKVSRHHATIAWLRDRYVIHDVGSSNGTFLNNRQLGKPEALSNGDEIRIGKTTFTVILSADETKPNYKPSAEEEAILKQAMVAPVAPPAEPALAAVENPYVGPRTFTQQEANRFFGREHEARELHSLVIAHRLVLFYAQSGAGKSSLINTRLVPQLRETGMPVLPIGRVSGELPQGIGSVENIFIFNLLLSLDESDGDPGRFTGMSLSRFLTNLTSLDGIHYYYDDSDDSPTQESGDTLYEPSPYILIIDQFEEIVTTHPARWQDREGFFHQLAQAMSADPYLWVVLTMREDYVAVLDPYAHLVPGNLRARFYMQRMGYESALEAITRPAEQYGRPFAPGVAESLADNLRQIRIYGAQADIQKRTQLGQFVEPVQLQVVCYQLWEKLKERPAGPITQQDLQELGNVNQALAQFYEQALADVIKQTGVSEIVLRNWFEEQLITEAGTKGTVYRGATRTGGIPNRAADLLAARFLLRSEVKAGGTWYELVHDRFIEPILLANQKWREHQPLIQVARNWKEAGRPSDRLLEGDPLKTALTGNWQALGQDVQEFLSASQETQRTKEEARRAEQEAQRQLALEQAQALAVERQQRLEEQAKATASLRRRATFITIMSVVAVIMAFAAGGFGWQAVARFQEAQAARQTAEAEKGRADTERLTAEANAELAITKEAEARAAQQTAEAENAAAAANAGEARDLLVTQSVLQTIVAEATATKQAEVAIAAATAESARATAAYEAAIPPTPTYTPVPTETATPVNSGTPIAAEPTHTPTATPTATPDFAPTATFEAGQNLAATETAIAVVNATQTTEARRSCKFEPEGRFGTVWIRYIRLLGCPVQQVIGGQYAEQPFQNGYMIWAGIPSLFFVMIGETEGPWYLIMNDEVDSYNPTDGVACRVEEPPARNLVQPIRGFGAIWCGREDIRKQIGWGTEPEFAVVNNQLQAFENGFILQDSRGFIYVLPTGADYIRIEN